MTDAAEPDWTGKCPRCGKTVLNHGDVCSRCQDAAAAETTRRQLEYLRMALRHSLGLPPDAPDEDIIDTAAERWAPKCDHAWTLIMRLDHCEIDAEDPIPHTAIVLLGCPRCRSVQAFPPQNVALITPRYLEIIRKDLEAQHWLWEKGV